MCRTHDKTGSLPSWVPSGGFQGTIGVDFPLACEGYGPEWWNLVDTVSLKLAVARLAGSSPVSGTTGSM